IPMPAPSAGSIHPVVLRRHESGSISAWMSSATPPTSPGTAIRSQGPNLLGSRFGRSEEHTSELQSLRHLVCRLLLEKKKSSDEGIHTMFHRLFLLLVAQREIQHNRNSDC